MMTINAPRTRNIKTHIDCDIMLADNRRIPFTAMPDDVAGADIYQRALRGNFGEIAIAPVEGEYQWIAGAWQQVAEEQTDVVQQAAARKARLLQQASEAIAPLQDAVDIGMATPAEQQALTDWKICRVLLNRIRPESAPDIDWPPIPEV